jgi:DNA polymerase-1
MFGFGADKAAVMIGCSKEEAQALIDTANESNPSMPEFKRAVWDDYKAHGGVSHSLYGREFRYPDILLPEHGKSKWLLYRAQRQAFNAKIQGTAADILKLLQLWTYKNVLPQFPGSFQIASVHDESLYLVPAQYASDFCSIVTAHYKNNAGYLPFVFVDGDCNQGNSWYDLK